jgi:integrase
MNHTKLSRGIFWRDCAYWIRYADRSGHMHREKIGPFLRQAEAAYRKRKSEVREGKFFPEKLKQRTVLFRELARDFLAYSKQNKRSYPHDVARMETLSRLWRDCPAIEMNPGRIERDLANCADENSWAEATYNRYRALASAVFSLAIRNSKLSTNPVRGTKHRIENNARVRYLGDDEEQRLFDNVRVTCPERELEILVALHSGMRRSEQYVIEDCAGSGLKWEHLDFRAGLLRLPRSKHGKSREIPMNSVLRGILLGIKRLRAGSELVFPIGSPSKWFQQLSTESKIRDFSWHCLRHTFASRLVMKGVDLRTVQELMGHRTIITTMRYAHLAPGHLAQAVECLCNSTSTATGTKASGRPPLEMAAAV